MHLEFAHALSTGDLRDMPTAKDGQFWCSHLLLIGTLLVAEGFHQKIPKSYVYFAMAFCLGVEMLQMKAGKPVAHEVTKAS